MTKTTSEQAQATDIDEQTVMDYLKNHPDALNRHPELLTQLNVDHQSGSAVSLVERQLRLLRDENQKLKDKLGNLVQIARENEELGQRFHRLSLELMAADSLHDIVAMTQNQVQTFFYTDYVSFCFHDALRDQLHGQENNIVDANSKYASQLRDWIHRRRAVFGPLETGMDQVFFGIHNQMQSCVLIPLYHTNDIGLLALGSKSKERFNPHKGTMFLDQLGELISHKLKNYLV
ncbi:MAG: DUF484 family protein [Gammaproteobacteria bacterium]|nr:DUF484 family protein [Gammaproteobacteria bacterium]